jgi:hypothetical protein
MMVTAKSLSDRDKALLFLYVTQVGMPPWAQHEDGQVELMMKLCDWTKERARKAFEDSSEAGLVDKHQDPLDAAVITED